MKCPFCDHEAHNILSLSPCPKCNKTWVDTYHYVEELAKDLPHIRTVLDIGCGLKGTIAQAYWEGRPDVLLTRRCFVEGCTETPQGWAPQQPDGSPSTVGICFCFRHQPEQVREHLQDPALFDVPIPVFAEGEARK